jgi:hypothetical protein
MKPPTPPAARGAAGKASAPAGEEHHVTFFGASRLAIAVLASAGLMAVSSGLILLNSHLLSHGFHFPMALGGLGMAFSGLASFLVCRVFRLVEARRAVTPRFFAVRIMPVGLFMALTLHFGNLVYLHLTVSFIQMLKAFTPIITMLFLFAAGASRRRLGVVGGRWAASCANRVGCAPRFAQFAQQQMNEFQ